MLILLALACTSDPALESAVDTFVQPTPFVMPEAWRPDITHYPRLHPHLDESGRAWVLARSERHPYKALLSRVRARAARNIANVSATDELYAPTAYSNADTAKAAAFIGWLDGDLELSNKALSSLEAMKTDASQLTEADDDIHLADALMSSATALDLLLGTEGLDATRLAAASANLAELAESTRFKYAEDLPQLHAVWRNNHASKTVAAVGMAALVLNTDPRAYQWMAYAQSEMLSLTEDMTDPATGIVDEGPYYHAYSAQTHLPFLLAYADLVTEDMPYPPVCALHPSDEACDEDFAADIGPLLYHPTVAAQHSWGVNIRMPDGTRFPFDDALLAGFFGGMLNDPVARWDWSQADALYLGNTLDLSMEALLRYDDEADQHPPDGDASVVTEHFAVLRSSWDADATAVFVNAEHGQPRDSGHEHEDEGSFALYAKGRFWALDPGYIKWAERDKVAHTEDHNLILVDGKGAPESSLLGGGGVDATLTDQGTEGSMEWVQVETAYAGAALQRRVVRAGDLVVVLDRVSSPGSHRYSWLLHGFAGGSSGGSAVLNDHGARWEHDSGAFDVVVAQSGTDPAASFVDAEHGLTYGNLQTHARYTLDGTGTDWAVAALLIPQSTSDEAPVVTVLQESPALLQVAALGQRVLIGSANTTSAWNATVCDGPLPDAGALVVLVDCEGAGATVLSW